MMDGAAWGVTAIPQGQRAGMLPFPPQPVRQPCMMENWPGADLGNGVQVKVRGGHWEGWTMRSSPGGPISEAEAQMMVGCTSVSTLCPVCSSSSKGMGYARPFVSPSWVTLDTHCSHFLFKNWRDNKSARKILSRMDDSNKFLSAGVLGAPGSKVNLLGTAGAPVFQCA